MALRELLLSLGVDVDKEGVKNADAALGKIKTAALAAAAAFVSIKAAKAVFSLVDNVRAMGDELDKTSKQIGISIEALEELRFAAELSGVGNKEFSNSLGRLQKNAFEAGKGNKTLAEDFKKLGINVKDASGELKSGEVLFTEFAEGISKLDNDTEKTALSMNLMGRTGKQLLPLFVDGAKGIALMREEARELGGIMSQELIDATVKLTDDQLRAQKAWQGIRNDIAGKLIPIFIKFSNIMVVVAKAVRGPLNKAFKVFSVILDGVVNIIDTLNGTFIEMIGIIVDSKILLTTLGFAFLFLGRKAVVAGIKTAAAWVIASLPIILMTLLVGFLLLAIEDFITFMQGGDSIIGRLVDKIKQWADDMGGIGPALKQLFLDIFMSILGVSKETANEIIVVFQSIWFATKEAFERVGTAIGEGLAAAFVFVTDFASDFVDAITGAIDFVVGKFEALTDAISDAIGAVAKFVGLGDEGARVDVAGDRKRAREQNKRIRDEATNRARVLKQVAREGFGTFVGATRTDAGFQASQLTNATAGAQERVTQLLQDINAPLTVNVNASGQSNPDAIAESVATKVVRTQNNRQIAQSFQTAK